LVVTYDKSYKVESQVEITDLFSLIHAESSYSAPFIEGAFKLVTVEDPRKIIRRLDYLWNLEPEKFRFSRNWVPVDRWCKSDLGQISDAVSEIGEGIQEEESWKILLRRSDSPSINTGKLIDILSHCILKPRSTLLNPQRIVLVHIIGAETAVSLLRPEDMLEIGDMSKPQMGRSGIEISLE
jgi:tRNA(Ser,Leu) C12 N-acetylase TAN1